MANFFEPVTFVRSPIMMKLLSGRSVSGSRPLKRVSGSMRGRVRGGLSATASAIARMWAGVVPQQPPTMFSQPLLGELAQRAGHHLGRLVEAAKGVRQAGVRIATHVDRRDPRQLFDVGPQLVRAPARS